MLTAVLCATCTQQLRNVAPSVVCISLNTVSAVFVFVRRSTLFICQLEAQGGGRVVTTHKPCF